MAAFIDKKDKQVDNIMDLLSKSPQKKKQKSPTKSVDKLKQAPKRKRYTHERKIVQYETWMSDVVTFVEFLLESLSAAGWEFKDGGQGQGDDLNKRVLYCAIEQLLPLQE